MKRKMLFPIVIGIMLLTACSDNKAITPEAETTINAELDKKLNTQEGNLSYTAKNSEASVLTMDENVSYKDGYYVDFENSDGVLYVASYDYNGKEYTAGYADNCDFKEYLELPDIVSAEAGTINDRDYQIAYYNNNGKAAYYYTAEDVCIYAYTENEMSDEEFKNDIEIMDIRMVENGLPDAEKSKKYAD